MKLFLITFRQNHRLADTLEHLNCFGIKPIVVDVLQGYKKHENTFRTIKHIVKENIDEENILIFEDDVRFYSDPNIAQIEADIKELDFTALSLGSFKYGVLKKIKDNFYDTSVYFGSQAVIYNKACFGVINSMHPSLYIDVEFSQAITNTLIYLPILSYQTDRKKEFDERRLSCPTV